MKSGSRVWGAPLIAEQKPSGVASLGMRLDLSESHPDPKLIVPVGNPNWIFFAALKSWCSSITWPPQPLQGTIAKVLVSGCLVLDLGSAAMGFLGDKLKVRSGLLAPFK